MNAGAHPLRRGSNRQFWQTGVMVLALEITGSARRKVLPEKESIGKRTAAQ